MGDTATPNDFMPAGTAVASPAVAAVSADPESGHLYGPRSNSGSRGDLQMGT